MNILAKAIQFAADKHSDLTRLKGVTEKDVARMQKYMRAFSRVEVLLAD
jgi:hypothetical protein